ncbi:MAG: bifunctional (p)ppGpp synthetase/guanosine-3',5'-bis(diphosphate) 3'-pyrophosphohydrolase [Chloroflexi bacterium]|nr:bifunctional (p)ppGpp synthetase/guanosine-3',5'-bis(diphosphate) 3'-pyrophosphohydrolase [Chloroflexota bacterium]
MLLNQLLAKAPASYSPSDKALIKDAYHFAEEAHAGQTRANGQPYLTHCVGTAAILLEMEFSPSMVAAGLLHDVLIDTDTKAETLHEKFGDTVARFVEDVTKITALPQLARADQTEDEQRAFEAQAPMTQSKLTENLSEFLRKMLLAIGDDIRVIIIKLADRVHNMRTLNALPPARQKKIARDTLDVYAPLANRLGIWQMKWELEDLGFRYTEPEKYREIAEHITAKSDKRQAEIEQIIHEIEEMLAKSGVKSNIYGRPKHIYSIYMKMRNKDKSFDSIRDLRALRIIVEDIETCYKVLGIVHMNYQPIPGEFDDYIAAKKENNYQSLHTAIIYKDGKPLEIQIRTWEMHKNAEYGVAAHWRYKEQDAHVSSNYEAKLNAMRNLLAWSQEFEDTQELNDQFRTDSFRDRIYALTPLGDVIELPAGATPIDFAYQVHTDVGNRCRGAKINGKLVPLSYTLKTGDQVEVLTANRGGPSRDWLNPSLGLVKSSRSRAKIRQWFKQQDRDQNLAHGKLLIEKEFKRLGVSDIDVEELAAQFNVKSLDDFYVAVGYDDIPITRVVARLGDMKQAKLGEQPLLIEQAKREEKTDSVHVMGLSGMLTQMARCCNPMPGDSIIGYITRGRGATIHRSNCPNVLRVKDAERLINVDWGTAEKTYPIPI